jgi:Cas6b C-terminal domain/Cas6b N-terminal domain
MKRLRILAVSFDTNIQPYQLPAFRGAIAAKVGWEHEWFHNHDNENGGTHNRYPLIQYKLDTYKGQMRPMLLCLENGIEEAHHLFSQPDWSVRLNGEALTLKIAQLNVNQYTLNTWERPFTYRVHKWQAMNPDNFKKYQLLRGIVERTSFLENLLRNQILSFAKGVNWDLAEDFTFKLLSLPREEWLSYKHRQKMLVFTVDFECNLSLPDYIGLGRGASRGLGVVRKMRERIFN